MKVVMKFGGTSVGDAERIRSVAGSISEASRRDQLVVVVSAMNGVTDRLIRIGDEAKKGSLKRVSNELDDLKRRHLDAVEGAIKDPTVKGEVFNTVSTRLVELGKTLEGIGVLRELTPRSRDLVLSFGERLATPIVWGAVREAGVRAEHFTGGEAGIVTDEEFGEANPLMNVSKMKITKRLEPLLEGGVVPIVTGFIAATQTGEVTTLGRGGSDYTATILGAALSVDEVWICTDVDGILTADPKIVQDTRIIPRLSYSEAFEMAAFGAKALHPKALGPAMEHGIPVWVKNTFNLSQCGTLIAEGQSVEPGEIVKAVALVRDVGMVNIGGAGMIGMPGIAARVFEVLGRVGINILMISQSVSEANISMVLKRGHLEKAVSSLEISLLGRGFADYVNAEDDVGVLAVVGAGMKGSPGVAARVFKAVSDRGINVRMIAQGSSELNISFVVKEGDCEEAVRAIHKEFRLSGG